MIEPTEAPSSVFGSQELVVKPYTKKCFATAAIYWSFTSLGLLIASLGPSLLGLERQTGATAENLAFVFTLRSVGYVVGSAGSPGRKPARLPRGSNPRPRD